MPIREAIASDLDEICTLIDELAAYEHLGEEVVFDKETMGSHLFGPRPGPRVVLAETDSGEIAGMALWFPTFSTFLGLPGIWLEDLFVRPAHRGRGYASSLLLYLRTLTEGRVEWAVLDWNTPAIELYDRLGATPITGWTRYRWSP